MNVKEILKLKARDLAEIIILTPIEHRAEMYRETAKLLKQASQGFTARLFDGIADLDDGGKKDG